MRQFTTLLWKEWRQLRGVRWSGVLLGAVLILILTASTLLGEAGSSSSLGYRTPSLEEIAFDTGPMVFGVLLWPLVALLAVVQAFTGDRATRCAEFLLLQPVSRRKTWFARLLAAGSSYAASALTSLGLLALLALMAGTGGRWARFGEALADAAEIQLIALPLALAGGSAAAAFGLTSFAALGLALTIALFAGASSLMLPGALILMPGTYSNKLGVFFLAPGVLLLLASAVWSSTRGEPAGTGAWKRALPVVLASVFLPPVSFIAANRPLTRWAEARSPYHSFVAARAGHLAFERGSGGFVVDTRSAERVAFLPPFVSGWAVGFREDGRRLAVVQDVRVFGVLATERSVLTIYDESGRLLREIDNKMLGCDPAFAGWVGERLLTSCYTGRREFKLFSLDGDGNLLGVVGQGLRGSWSAAGTDILGRDLVCLRDQRTNETWDTRLVALDPESGRLDERPVARAYAASGPHCARRLAPDGRYYLSNRDSLTDLRDGSLMPMPTRVADDDNARSLLVTKGRLVQLWTSRGGDRSRELELFEIESGDARALHSWPEDSWVEPKASPDRSQVLISVNRVVDEEPGKRWEQVETWLLDVEKAELSALPVNAFDWAGRDVLAVRKGERLGLWRIGDPPDAVKLLH